MISNGIETFCHQKHPSNDIKHITIFAKNGNVQKKRHCKNNMASLRSKSETAVIIIIYNKNHIKTVPTTPVARGGTGSYEKRKSL